MQPEIIRIERSAAAALCFLACAAGVLSTWIIVLEFSK